MQQAIEDRRGDDAVAEDLASLPKPLLDVRKMLPRSLRAETSVKKAVAASRRGPHAELVDDEQPSAPRRSAARARGDARPGRAGGPRAVRAPARSRRRSPAR